MSEELSKLQLIGKIAEANNKNLELIEELNDREDEIERLNNIIKEVREYIESKVISSNEVIDQLRKSEIREVLEILDKENKK